TLRRQLEPITGANGLVLRAMEANSNVVRGDPLPNIELEHYRDPSGVSRPPSRTTHEWPQSTSGKKTARRKANTRSWWTNNISLSLPYSSNENPAQNHDPRDYLALERNFLAHIRTANALVLFGVFLFQLFRLERLDSTAGLALSATCAGGAMMIVLAGAYRYFLIQSRMKHGKATTGGLALWVAGTVILGVTSAVFVSVDWDGVQLPKLTSANKTDALDRMRGGSDTEAFQSLGTHCWGPLIPPTKHSLQQAASSTGATTSAITMFKKDISPGAKSKVKSSVQRAIRTKITETYPGLAPHIDEIIPKKSQLDSLKL
ncbi:MAG: hypothetical protein Q9180_007443, partial [Flavoplaca navasiana]